MKSTFVIFAAASISLGAFIGGMSMGIQVPDAAVTNDTHENAVDFKNDLIPMFTKLGCNAGKCHGSAIGRGDFKLSLYGGTPEADYDEIVRKFGGRRIDLTDPESSLVFMKPAEYVEHGGGTIITDGDDNAQRLIKWIEQWAYDVEHRQL